jgi:hypothetical protein
MLTYSEMANARIAELAGEVVTLASARRDENEPAANRYSLARAVRALVDGSPQKSGHEWETSQMLARSGRTPATGTASSFRPTSWCAIRSET